MTPPFLVRRAAVTDAAILAALAVRTFQEAFGAMVSPDAMATYLAKSFAEETVHAELADPATVFLLAETDGGEPAGYAKLHFGTPLPQVKGAKPAKLWRLYTLTEVQGQGAGALLLAFAAGVATERGCETLWLTVNTGNTGAVRFYTRHGFFQTGFTGFNLGGEPQHDFVMERDL